MTKAGRVRPTRRRRLTILEAEVGDETGRITATWFNQAWLADKLTPGTRLLLRGKLEKRGFNVAEHELARRAIRGRCPPGYTPPAWSRSTRRPSGCARRGFASGPGRRRPLAPNALEPLPRRARSADRMPGVADALVASHFPADEGQAAEARRRLAFEELLLYQATLAARRRRRAQSGRGPRSGPPASGWAAGSSRCRSSSTGDQLAALDEIDADLAGPSRCSGC